MAADGQDGGGRNSEIGLGFDFIFYMEVEEGGSHNP